MLKREVERMKKNELVRVPGLAENIFFDSLFGSYSKHISENVCLFFLPSNILTTVLIRFSEVFYRILSKKFFFKEGEPYSI